MLEDEIDAHDAEHETEIADAGDDEGLDGRRVRRRPLIPEADQQVGAETHPLPAEEELHEIVGRDQHQHAEGEQAEIAHEARDRGIAVHVADGIDMDHGRDGGDDDQHHRGQLVDADRPMRLEAARQEPGEDLRRARRPVMQAHIEEDDPGEHHGDQESGAGDELGAPVADMAPEEPGDGSRHQRQEDHHDVHRAVSPSSC